MLTYCFESSHVPRTLAKCKKNDLAVIDTEGHELSVKEAVKRGVWVYGYLNVGAVEKDRPYNTDAYIAGTTKEQAFDVITVNYADNSVKFVRIGRGADRTFTA